MDVFVIVGGGEGIDIFRVFPILPLLNTEQIPSAFLTVSMYLPIMPAIDYWLFLLNLFNISTNLLIGSVEDTRSLYEAFMKIFLWIFLVFLFHGVSTGVNVLFTHISIFSSALLV